MVATAFRRQKGKEKIFLLWCITLSNGVCKAWTTAAKPSFKGQCAHGKRYGQLCQLVLRSLSGNSSESLTEPLSIIGVFHIYCSIKLWLILVISTFFKKNIDRLTQIKKKEVK